VKSFQFRFTAFVAAILLPGLAGAAESPSFTSFDVPGVAPTFFFVPGINDAGVIAGTYQLADGTSFGFVRKPDGNIRAPIADPNASGLTTLHSINEEGTKAGFYCDNVTCHGFLLQEGNFTTYDVPGAASTGVRSINNRGDLAGTYYLTLNPSDVGAGFIATARGDLITFTPPDPTTTVFNIGGLNDRRAAVGFAVTSSGNFGILRKPDGSFVNIAYPGAAVTHLFSINDCGIFVGWWHLGGVTHGLYGRPNRLNSFDLAGAIDVQSHGINNKGQITGQWTDANGALHGFVTAPIAAAGCDD